MQLAAPRLPASPAALEKLTVPDGRIAVPAASESDTVAVHVEAWLITTEPGTHVTVVVVARLAAVTVSPSLLVRWLVSPP